MRSITGFLLLACAAAPVAAQADPDRAVAGGGDLPAGWMARTDRPSQSLADVRFSTMGDGFHVTNGPPVILYRPSDVATGAYVVSATFAQTQQPEHAEAYGLIAGGRDLDGDSQDYLYFLIRKNGDFLVKHRAGSDTHDVIPWTMHDAVNRPGADGRVSNTLAIDAGPERVRFLVNNVEVAALDRVPMLRTDGIAGLRINHNLDAHITGFAITKK